MKTIKNILFDIGHVLLSFYPEAAAREFAVYSSRPADRFGPEHVFLPEILHSFERGQISSEQYYEAFIQESGCRMSFRHFSILWCKHFSLIRPMVELGRKLSRKYSIYFFSDTSPLHVPPLYHLFPALLFFHGQALSYELGAMKPEREFFQLACERLGLDPAECLFIDDQPANVDVARDFGIRSIHHRDPEQSASGILAALDLA
ncbi:MAG: HAD family phosphatase [Gemmatimonadota bacterium]|nr:HAD family phosphatase [Gemmatimonadota bacterium]